jgi:hypothetical protein
MTMEKKVFILPTLRMHAPDSESEEEDRSCHSLCNTN